MTVFRILAVLLCMLAAPAYAQVENQDYKTLHPADPPAATEKVEVIEFFSYACPHCFAMQPHVEKWAASHGAKRLSVTSAMHREATHEFYEKRDYERNGVRFAKRLS